MVATVQTQRKLHYIFCRLSTDRKILDR